MDINKYVRNNPYFIVNDATQDDWEIVHESKEIYTRGSSDYKDWDIIVNLKNGIKYKVIHEYDFKDNKYSEHEYSIIAKISGKYYFITEAIHS